VSQSCAVIGYSAYSYICISREACSSAAPQQENEALQSCDWVEQPEFLKLLGVADKEDVSAIYGQLLSLSYQLQDTRAHRRHLVFHHSDDVYYLPQHPARQAVPESQTAARKSIPSPEDITEWYIRRARDIDALSGQVQHALSLVRMGQDKGMASLSHAYNHLRIISVLVYQCHQELSVAEYEEMTPYGRLCLLLGGATDQTIMHLIRDIALPLLPSLAENETGIAELGGKGLALLTQWLIETAKGEHFNWCCEVIYSSRPSSDNPKHLRVIHDVPTLLQLALSIVYGCPRTDPAVWELFHVVYQVRDYFPFYMTLRIPEYPPIMTSPTTVPSSTFS